MSLDVSRVQTKKEYEVPGFSHFHAARLIPDSRETLEDSRFSKIKEQINLAYSEVPDSDLKIIANLIRLSPESVISVADLGLQGDCYLLADGHGGFALEAILMLTTPFCPKSGKMKDQLKSALLERLSGLQVKTVVVKDQFEYLSEIAFSDMPEDLADFKSSREGKNRDQFSRLSVKAVTEFAPIIFNEIEGQSLQDSRRGQLAVVSTRSLLEYNSAWVKPTAISKWLEYKAAAKKLDPQEFNSIKSNFDSFNSFLEAAEQFQNSGIPAEPEICSRLREPCSASDPAFIEIQEKLLRFFSSTKVDLSQASISN